MVYIMLRSLAYMWKFNFNTSLVYEKFSNFTNLWSIYVSYNASMWFVSDYYDTQGQSVCVSHTNQNGLLPEYNIMVNHQPFSFYIFDTCYQNN